MTSQPTGAPPASLAARRRRVALGVALFLGVAGAAAWWQFGKPAPGTPVPAVPGGIQETEVLHYLERHRAKVVAEPTSAEAWGEYAVVLLSHLFDAEAKACFAEAARLAPDDPRWPYGLAQIALKRDPGRAPDLLRTTIATTGVGEEYRAAARLTLAETLLERGEVDAAAAVFDAELGPPPGQPRARFGLALVAVARGDVATATRLFSSLLESEYARKQASAHLARLSRERGDEPAAGRFERAAAALPDDYAWPDPLLDLTARLAVGRRGRDRRIDELELAGRHEEALALYLADLEEGRTARALLGAGANHVRLGNSRRVLEPEAARGHYSRALELVREAVALEPKSPHAQYTLALTYTVPAEVEHDRDPNSPQAKEWFRKAAEHARIATELKPDHARAYLHWGLALYYLGESPAAVGPLRKGLLVRPEDFDLHFVLGRVLAATGDTAGAEAEFKAAKSLGPDDPRPDRELEKLKGKK